MSARMCIDANHSDGGSGGGRVFQCLDAALHVGSVCDIAILCDSVVVQKEGALLGIHGVSPSLSFLHHVVYSFIKVVAVIIAEGF